MWLSGSNLTTRTISTGVSDAYGLFVTVNGEIFVDSDNYGKRQVNKWLWNATNNILVMNVTSRCFSMFIDIYGGLYCSLDSENKVIRKSMMDGSNTIETIAGNGTAGSGAYMLYSPNGIFVDKNFKLYVADYGNNRVQLFQSGQPNATTLIGNGAPNTITLNGPMGIVLDGDGYLFITDYNNHRIIRSGPFGCQCLFGCSNGPGSATNQLNYPHSLSFDSYGNLFVADLGNHRIQKLFLMTNSCGKPRTPYLCLLVVFFIASASYNQPKLSSCATWNSNAITLANSSVVGTQPIDSFVDTNNTLYVADFINGRLQIWSDGNMTAMKTIFGGFNLTRSIFVTTNGNIYIDNGKFNGRIDKWTLNATVGVVAWYVNDTCYGVFVDLNDNLYCSTELGHQILRKAAKDSVNSSTRIAGSGNAGSASHMLNGPRGLFVDMNFNLYVADAYNNRIQYFRPGQFNGTTVAGNGAPNTITLQLPIDIVLDADEYLYIIEYGNDRVVASGPSGFRCIIACTGSSGSTANRLYNPCSLNFDNDANLIVSDTDNQRIQKFLLATNSCGKVC